MFVFRVFILFFAVVFSFFIKNTSAAEIDELDDSQLANVINHNEFVLAFLEPGNCDSAKCHSALHEFKLIADTTFLSNLKIVRVPQSQILRTISSGSLPRILFYRRGVPILYDSDLIEHHDVVVWMEQNKETGVHILDSVNFEHLTQAASGSTTGDWFVLFQSSECLQLTPIWEAVASRLKHRLNVATVDMENNPELKIRFGVTKCPTVRFFHLGKMFFYELPSTDVGALAKFAEGWYKNAVSQPVPPKPTPFDVLVDQVVMWIKTNLSNRGMELLVVGFILFVVFMVLVLFCCSIKESSQKYESKID